jgi:hypothetical protein
MSGFPYLPTRRRKLLMTIESAPSDASIYRKGKGCYIRRTQTKQARTYTQEAKRSCGRVFVCNNGKRFYSNDYPHFLCELLPARASGSEEVWYREWEHESIPYGYNVTPRYEELKAAPRLP